jgi:hypothetical protein
MHCINTNLPEYQRLVASTNEHPHVLQYKISLWMDHNGSHRFPTAEEISEIPVGKGQFHQVHPIKQLAFKYNMNTAGFMPSNVDLAQVQRDAMKYNLTTHRAASGMWFFKDGNKRFVNPHKYRQLESSTESPIQELTDKLKKWAHTHGISVTTMEALIEQSEGSGSFGGSVAVADLLNKIIAIDPNLEGIDTMAEEVAHFATHILQDDVSVKKAMEKIEATEIYQEVKEQYADVYTDEAQFKKEAMDKLLTQAILSEFQQTEQNKGIIAYLKAIFNKIKRWLNKQHNSSAAEEIKNDLMPIAQSIIKNEYLGTANTKPGDTVYHQKKSLIYEKEKETEILKGIENTAERAKAKFAMETANQLNDRLNILRRKEKNEKVLGRLEDQIESLQEQIAANEFTASVMGIIGLAKEELPSVQGLLTKHKENGTTDGNDLELVQNFIEMYDHLFERLQTDIHFYNFSAEEKTDLLKILSDTLRYIRDIEGQARALNKRHAINVLREGNTGPDGSKIDPSFDEVEAFEYTKDDTNWWRLYMGNYKFSNSPILRTVHKLLFDAAQKVKRHTLDVGHTLLQAQVLMEKSGVKVEDLIEKDANGKYTQYLVRREDWSSYFKAREEMKKEMEKHFGVENFADLQYDKLDKQKKKEYRSILSKFNKEHTTKIYNEKGEYERSVPKKLNPKYQQLMKNPHVKNYYDLLVATKREALSKLPPHYRSESRVFLLPGIRQQFLERMTDRNHGFLTNLREIGKESFFLDEDDTQFGEVSALNNRMVPIYFNQKFDDPAHVSRDLTRSFSIFSEMAENLKSMGTLSGDIEVLKRELGRREYKKGKKNVSGKETNDYKVLETMLASHVYNIEKKDATVHVPENWLTKAIGINDKNFSTTKFMQAFTKYISTNNLAMNIYTSTAGAIKGSIDSIVEDQVGLYTTVESKNWARGEYARNIAHVLSEVPKKKQTNKMHLLLQRNNVVELGKMLTNTNKNKLMSEVVSRDMLFINYRTADYAIKGRVALSVYDNTRLVGDKFMTRKQFIEAKQKAGIPKTTYNKEWKALRTKSLYNAYHVVDGKLAVKEEFKPYINDAIENITAGRITHVSNIVDGSLSDSDKGELARSVYGDFMLMHRGWFINTIDTRFMKEKTLMTTGEKEIGYYPAAWSFIKNDIIHDKNLTPWAMVGAYRNMEDGAVKRGVKKTFLDLLYLQLIGLIAAIANVAADDDDDDNFLLQYSAYQLNRVLLEQAAGQPLMNPSEILQIIDEPVVGVRTIKDIVDIGEAFNFKEYKSGMYKGSSHAKKWWLRKIPALKNVYEFPEAELKNNFLQNQVISNKYYDLLKEKKDGDELTILERLSLLFRDQKHSNMSEREAVNYIAAMEEDM